MEIKCFVSLLYPHNKYHKKKINILLKNIEEIKVKEDESKKNKIMLF